MIALMILMCHPPVPLVLQSYFDSGLGHVICLASGKVTNLSQVAAYKSACMFLCSLCFSAVITGTCSSQPADMPTLDCWKNTLGRTVSSTPRLLKTRQPADYPPPAHRHLNSFTITYNTLCDLTPASGLISPHWALALPAFYCPQKLFLNSRLLLCPVPRASSITTQISQLVLSHFKSQFRCFLRNILPGHPINCFVYLAYLSPQPA